MSNFVLDLVNQYGYLGMFLGMVLEAVIIVIPSEAILATGGILASQKIFTFIGIIIALTVAKCNILEDVFIDDFRQSIVKFWDKKKTPGKNQAFLKNSN